METSHQPNLETPRLLLRRFREDDAASMFEYTSDPEVTKFLSWNTHQVVDDARRYIKTALAEYDRGEWPGWGIEYQEEDKLVGAISLRNFNQDHRQTELSYVLNRAYAGRGIMSEAVARVLRHCFDTLGLERVEARCMSENLASEKVMVKVGMRYEGTLRKHQLIKGKYHDFKVYSILRSELGTDPS